MDQPPIAPNEMKRAVRRFANKKAPGSDGIQAIPLKRAPDKLVTKLAQIGDHCFLLGYHLKR